MKGLEKFITENLWLLPEVQNKVLELIKTQLSNGESPLGKIGEYKNPSYAKFKGVPIDRIDLKLTGEYWDSFKVRVNTESILIETSNKPFLIEKYPSHLALTDESIKLLTIYLIPIIKDYVLRQYSEFALKGLR